VINGALVVGFGNGLRTDDGAGRDAAERLARDPRLGGATVIGRHQLTPELAFDVSRAAFVVFVDASRGPAPGTIVIERVESGGGSASRWSHHVTPAGLVALARELYGREPVAFAVSVGAESTEVGDRLTATMERAMPGLVDAVARLVAERSPRSAMTGSGQPGRA